MYNGLDLYLTENRFLYNKQPGFQNGHSTDHNLIKQADQIHDILNKSI